MNKHDSDVVPITKKKDELMEELKGKLVDVIAAEQDSFWVGYQAGFMDGFQECVNLLDKLREELRR